MEKRTAWIPGGVAVAFGVAVDVSGYINPLLTSWLLVGGVALLVAAYVRPFSRLHIRWPFRSPFFLPEPPETRELRLRLEDENAAQKVTIRQLEKKNAELQSSNSLMSHEREGRRGWESERERMVSEVHELKLSVQEKERQCVQIAEEKQELAAENDVLIQRNNALETSLAEASQKISALEASCVELSEVQIYGEALEKYPTLSEADYAVMISRVGELRSSLMVLRDATYGVWSRFTGWSELIENHMSEASWLGKLLTSRVWLPFRNAAQSLDAYLENAPEKDPRPFLLLVCKRHEVMKVWITHLIDMGKATATEPAYAKWQEATNRFETLLGEKLGVNQLRDVNVNVEKYRRTLRRLPRDEIL